MESDSPSIAIGPRQYWCFLSYRHSDNKRPGRQWASWLHHALETYEIPGDLVGKTNDRGDTIPERIYPVFRDEEELSADAQLTKPIEQALAHSRYLVVLCSPEAVESRFVEEEIIRFKTLRPENRERLLAAIIAGDPTSRAAAGAELPYPARQCFPRPLRYEVAPDGTLTEQPTEPIAADFRLPDGGEGFTSAEAYRAQLGKAGSSMRVVEYQQRLELMKLKIVAGILGIPLGLLTARDQAYQIEKERQRAKTLRRWLAAVAALTVLALAAGGFAWYQRGIARYERSQAQISEGKAVANAKRALEELKEASRSDVASAQARLAEGKWQEAVAYLGRAIRYDPENRNAQDGLWLALRYGKRDAGAMPRFVWEHPDDVRSASFNEDGAQLLTVSGKAVRLWNTQNGQLLGQPMEHPDTVNAACFCFRDPRIATACDDHFARLWSEPEGKLIGMPWEHPDRVLAVAADSHGVVSSSQDGTLQFFDSGNARRSSGSAKVQLSEPALSLQIQPEFMLLLTAGAGPAAQFRRPFGGIPYAGAGSPVGRALAHADTVYTASFSPDGRLAVTASADHTARLWKVPDGEPASPPLAHNAVVWNASFNPDGSRVVTASQDGTARLWDVATGQLVGAPLPHEGGVLTATFSPDGALVLTTSHDGTAHLWDADTGLPLGGPLQHGDSVLTGAFSPNGTRLVTTSRDHTARLWNTTTSLPGGVPFDHTATVRTACFSPDGVCIVTASEDQTARVWDAHTGAPLTAPLHHEAAITDVQVSAPGRLVVTASEDRSARLWEMPSGKMRHVLQHGAAVNSVRFSPDGSRVVTASDDHTARLWSTDSGAPLGATLTHDDAVLGACFSPDGSRVLTCSADQTARLWDAQTGQPIGPRFQHEKSVLRAIFSPDGSRILTASEDSTARLWDAKSGKQIGAPFRHGDFVIGVVFSPDGTHLATSSDDQTVRLWNALTGAPIGPPMRHRGWPLGLSFSPDGSRLVTACNDGTVRVWDAANAQPLGPPLLHRGAALSACFSPDGSQVLSTSEDHTARLWDLRMGAFLAPEQAEDLAAFFSGTRLDPVLGSLQPVTYSERLALWTKLQQSLAPSPEWRFNAARLIEHDPTSALVSPRSTITIRKASTRLLRTLHEDLPAEVLAIDPTNPVLPFGLAVFESTPQSEDHPAAQNLTRAAWLCAHSYPGPEADLVLAARLVAKVAKVLPKQKAIALRLLDGILPRVPEDEEIERLRAELTK